MSQGACLYGCETEIFNEAQEQEIQQLIARFQAQELRGDTVAQLEILVRTAVFQSANELVGWLLQQAAHHIDSVYQPKPGEVRKARESIQAQGIFGSFPLARDYYYHAGKDQGHYPADDALGLEVSYRVVLIDGAQGLENLGKLNFKQKNGQDCVQ